MGNGLILLESTLSTRGNFANKAVTTGSGEVKELYPFYVESTDMRTILKQIHNKAAIKIAWGREGVINKG